MAITEPDAADDVAEVLGELVDDLEEIDWRVVPTISTPEAAAWTQRVIEARDAARTLGGEGDAA